MVQARVGAGRATRAAEADVVAAVELALAGDELAGRLAGKIGVKGAADDPPHRLPGLEDIRPAGKVIGLERSSSHSQTLPVIW